MIRPIDIRLNAAHPELPLAEAVTFTGSPSTVLIRGVPPNCGRWAITAVFVAATYPDGSTTTRAAVQSANGVWVATLPATARSGRTENGLRVMADGIDENGAAVTGYILGVADFAVASLGVTPAPEPGETSWQMLYFDAVPGTLRKGDVAKVDGVLKLYNGTAWEAFAGDIPAPSTATPAMDGTGAAGTSAAFARGDHVHPSDTSKQNALSTQQLANIAAVSDALAFDATHTYAAGDPVVYDGTLYTFTSAHTGAWTGSDVSAVDIIARLAGKANDADVVHKTGDETIAGNKTFTGGTVMQGGLDVPWIYLYQLRIMTNAGDIYIPDAESGTLALAAHNPTAGNLAALDANGNPTDSGIAPGDKFDSTSVADAFSTSPSRQYEVGDLCTYNGRLYVCTTPTIGGTWNSESWDIAWLPILPPLIAPDHLVKFSAGQALTDSGIATANVALKGDIPYSIGTPTVIDTASSETVEGETVNYGAATLANRTANIVQVTAATALDELRITFPAATNGKVRDFGLRVEIGTGSAALTAPALVPVAPTGETIKIENADGTIPELADGTATAKGVTLLYFSENAPGIFVVKGEQVEEVA